MSMDSTLTRGMTKARELRPEQKFVSLIPWLVAAGALMLYLLTFNHWISLTSLSQVARVGGWTWQPELSGPLYWLLTLPLSLLPAAAIPAALNLFSLVCAVLTVGLLARSVGLLPHDRTEAQRLRERSEAALLSMRWAWVPPVMAAIVCGLQLTFWEHATSASGEMLDLLLFAYVIRCLLEYRVAEEDSWLFRSSVVYGAAMANNWAMVGFFPPFLLAMFWIKGKSFFNAQFLGRMFILGVAGLSLYLLLPLVNALSSGSHIGFWEALRANLASQKRTVLALPYNRSVLLHGLDSMHSDRPLWVLGLPSLLPVLLMGIRWPTYFGDLSKLGIALNRLIFHFVHAVLLVVCVWVALDPERFSPRHLFPELPLLTLYYLGALSVGYYSGYILLVFGVKPLGRQRSVAGYMPLVDAVAIAGVWFLFIGGAALLLFQNFPQIRITNGPMLRNYANAMAENVPKQSSIVLSDDPGRLLLLQAARARTGTTESCLFLDTGSLAWPDYHRFLHVKYPQLWQHLPPKGTTQVSDLELIRLVAAMAQTNALYYLHPSFGYYFEVFYPEPHGLVYRLNFYPTNSLLAPHTSKELQANNVAFWNRFDDSALGSFSRAVGSLDSQHTRTSFERVGRRLHLSQEANRDAAFLARIYSRSINAWGVELQRGGELPQAARWFQRALDFNPDNVIAQVNLECNTNLQAGTKNFIIANKAAEEEFRKYNSWDQVMRANGPFDEPSFCYAQGWAFLQGGNYRQAAAQFDRVRTLAPENLPSRLMLAQIYTSARLPDKSLEIVNEVRAAPAIFGITRTNELQLFTIEMAANLAKNDVAGAESAIRANLKKYPNDSDFLASATKAYMDFGRYSNALTTIEQSLTANPRDSIALLNKGNAFLQLKSFAQAIEPLTRVVQMETNNFSKPHYLALFMRAKAYLNIDQLDAAQRDYQELKAALPTEFPVYYDLGEIAYRRHDTKAALDNYEGYLAHAPTNLTEEIKFVKDRIRKIKQDSP